MIGKQQNVLPRSFKKICHIVTDPVREIRGKMMANLAQCAFLG